MLKLAARRADDEVVTVPGLALFTRRSTPPASIAVDEGWLAKLPVADRPYAWRVSVPLRRPGPDGLARDVKEVERLAIVGRTVVAAVPSGVLAAATTSAGVRTWLIYAAGADPSPSLASAGGPEYPAIAAVESDPDWNGYRALLPAEAEAAGVARRRAESDAVTAARANTKRTLQSLRAAGVDLGRPAAVRYRLEGTPSPALTARAAAEGMRLEDGPPLALVRDDLPDLALILRTERWLIHEACRTGTRYAGWSVADAG